MTDKTEKSITSLPNINPDILARSGRKKRRRYSVSEYVDGIVSGNRTILSQAITLAESSLPGDYECAQEVIEKCLPHSAKSVRIGITGVPGVGKSTFIEAFGLHLVSLGKKTAVLTIDPSSNISKGSILGDKTRMEKLSVHPSAFIRPSPNSGRPGGVARMTRESIIMCEAAGFDTIIVETVGVGQSETAIHSMVDVFMLLLLARAGDELQGIKRGIMELADIIAITKADGDNIQAAENARITFTGALSLFPPHESGWKPRVLTCSAKQNKGIAELWDTIQEYLIFVKQSGYFEEFRKRQAVIRMHDTISECLNNSFYNNEEVKNLIPLMENLLYEGKITSYKAALTLLEKYFKR
ncbi:MAG: methylmalonyl Co-A mutase-associated GTPase MeaB [Bacteroidales bacterium]|nr:methylmalonyl Co-A mutase-associated GTPase MeaB [Bacteroidales bacterium]